MIQEWYKALARREQRILVVALPLMIALVVWLFVVTPLKNQLVQQGDKLTQQQRVLEWMESASYRLEALRDQVPRNTSSNRSIQLQVNKLTRQFSLSVSRLLVNNEQKLTLQLNDSSYRNVIRFLDELQQQGLTVEQAKIKAAQKSGRVNTQLIISRRAVQP